MIFFYLRIVCPWYNRLGITNKKNTMCNIPFAYIQLCPSGWFTCYGGSVSCIDEAFVCDCETDCDDGSDETTTYATCDANVLATCPSSAHSKCSMILLSKCCYISFTMNGAQ